MAPESQRGCESQTISATRSGQAGRLPSLHLHLKYVACCAGCQVWQVATAIILGSIFITLPRPLIKYLLNVAD